ncbi:hypothetical protein GCM10010371_25300 [Streptomyces subrutilus]|uniref:Uncharacterized protein n=1 Tax=Streptomyces subrutilus TaxID=36818 RepID=A0A918V3M6_9ACTN|nr:hypothetical protein GCM10010371_25300 [Streptomyces subrutilus]
MNASHRSAFPARSIVRRSGADGFAPHDEHFGTVTGPAWPPWSASLERMTATRRMDGGLRYGRGRAPAPPAGLGRTVPGRQVTAGL